VWLLVLGCVVGCVGFRCHIICVMLPGVSGNAEVERVHAVYGCRKGYVCLICVCVRGCKPLYGEGGLACM
jgi:hypothetical protein